MDGRDNYLTGRAATEGYNDKANGWPGQGDDDEEDRRTGRGDDGEDGRGG